MGAPNITFDVSRSKISNASGYDSLSVSFTADGAYSAFECRATRTGEDWGVGMGALVASFSATPEGTQRTFEIYDDYLLQGDGEYRISLYVQAADGSWNDTFGFIPSDTDSVMICADGTEFLSRKGDT